MCITVVLFALPIPFPSRNELIDSPANQLRALMFTLNGFRMRMSLLCTAKFVRLNEISGFNKTPIRGADRISK